MKILTFDIETAPNMAYVWGLWKQNVGTNMLINDGSILCWAAKWLGEDAVMAERIDGATSELDLAISLAELIEEADIVITYNGNNFDMPWLNTVLVSNGITPPTNAKSIDLLRVVRNRFRFVSNKLDFVAQKLGLGSKNKHSGFELWLGCMAGDEASWKEMVDYNKQDVVLTENLYLMLRPWIKNHPNVNLVDGGNVMKCAACGSEDLKKNGVEYLAVGAYQRYKCGSCGAPNRGRTMINPLEDRKVLTTVV